MCFIQFYKPKVIKDINKKELLFLYVLFKDGSYNLYRRQENDIWRQVSNASGTSAEGIIDSTAEPGIVYEYCVRPSGSPSQNDSYIAFASKVMDEVFTTEKASVGFVLPTPTITGAPRLCP